MSLAQCDKCDKLILFAWSPKGLEERLAGKRIKPNMPLDAKPLEGATDSRLTPKLVVYRLETTYEDNNCIPVPRDEMATTPGPLFISHFPTCPAAGYFSKSKGKKREPAPSRQEQMI